MEPRAPLVAAPPELMTTAPLDPPRDEPVVTLMIPEVPAATEPLASSTPPLLPAPELTPPLRTLTPPLPAPGAMADAATAPLAMAMEALETGPLPATSIVLNDAAVVLPLGPGAAASNGPPQHTSDPQGCF